MEDALRTVLLWDTVKDRLHSKATVGLSLSDLIRKRTVPQRA
ncbi:hypothetical protein WCLP8_3590001 [uncultured Gammaproteobacteria bacterium]